MAWTSPKTWVVGDVLTASDMNTYVRDNTSYLDSQIVSGLVLAASDTANNGTYNNTTVGDKVTLTVSVPVGTPFRIDTYFTFNGGTSSTLSLGYKVNSTKVMATNGDTVTPATTSAGAGVLTMQSMPHTSFTTSPIISYSYRGVSEGGAGVITPSATMPAAAITSITVYGLTSNGSIVYSIRGIYVWTYPTS